MIKRILALKTYRDWFYAPDCSAEYAVERLEVLGFRWAGWRWVVPQREVFVRRVMR